jgi:hypothetical protein
VSVVQHVQMKILPALMLSVVMTDRHMAQSVSSNSLPVATRRTLWFRHLDLVKVRTNVIILIFPLLANVHSACVKSF